jgi:ProP effector
MKFTKKHKDIKKGKELHPTTAMVNNVQREQSRAAVRSVLTWLSKTFPKAFNVEGAIRPLKVGILEDILAYAEQNGGLPFSKTKLIKALVVFTRRMEYLTCVKMRDTRIDLNGEEVEPVSEEAAKLAVLRIKKTIEKTMRPHRKPAATRNTNSERNFRSGPSGQKRRFPSSHTHSPSHHSNYNPYHDHSSRDRDPQQGGYQHHSSEEQPSATATIKVKRRYAPRQYDNTNSNPYQAGALNERSPSSYQQPEKNYNSESYNTPLSTVDRLKEKLGIKRRKESFNYED